MAFDRAGTLYVCDGVKGLLAVSPAGQLRTLATGYGGLPFGFTNDVDVGPDGTVYFTDASSAFGPSGYREDILEHGGRGRLLAFHPDTGRTELLLAGLEFANGVAVGGDGSFLVVNETGSYRMVRYFIAGPRKGTSEPFFENLPGFPDNVTWSASRHVFWVALFSPRVAALDFLAPHPFLRTVVRRLPLFVQPQPKPVGWAVAIDEAGHVVESLQDASQGAYAPVTSVREANGTLWLGSLESDALGRLDLPGGPERHLPPAAPRAGLVRGGRLRRPLARRLAAGPRPRAGPESLGAPDCARRDRHDAPPPADGRGLPVGDGAARPMGRGPGWNEFDHEDVLRAHEPRFRDRLARDGGIGGPDGPGTAFRRLFLAAVARWVGGGHDAEYVESWPAFLARVDAAVSRLVGAAAGGSVLVFTSGGPIAAACRRPLGVPDGGTLDLVWRLANAGATELCSDGDGLKLLSFNDHAHLAAAAPELVTFR